MNVYLEVTRRRAFASVVDWPGLARSGKTEEDALDALLTYVPRYQKTLGATARELKVPADRAQLNVTERLEGNATTEFGAPGVIPDADRAPVSEEQLDDLIELLKASWRAFDRAVESAEGARLAPSGPRGGGRELQKIVEHVIGADGGYTGAVGGKPPREGGEWKPVQDAFVEAVRARARGELPDRGPRGGERWPARFAVRRSAWHALDHAWEIEDRAEG